MKKDLFILALLCAGYADGSHDQVVVSDPIHWSYPKLMNTKIPKEKLPAFIERLRSAFSKIKVGVPDVYGRNKEYTIHLTKNLCAGVLGFNPNDSEFNNAWNDPAIRELAIAQKHGPMWLHSRLDRYQNEKFEGKKHSFDPVIPSLRLYAVQQLTSIAADLNYGIIHNPKTGRKSALNQSEIAAVLGLSTSDVQALQNQLNKLKNNETNYTDLQNLESCINVFKYIIWQQIYGYLRGAEQTAVSQFQATTLKREGRALELAIKIKDDLNEEHTVIRVLMPHWYAPKISAKNPLLPYHQIVKDFDGKDWIFGYYGQPGEALSIKYYGSKMEQDDKELYELSPEERRNMQAIQAFGTFIEIKTPDSGAIRLFPSGIAMQHNFLAKKMLQKKNFRHPNKKLISSDDSSQQNKGQKTDNPVSLSIIQPTPQSATADKDINNANNNNYDSNIANSDYNNTDNNDNNNNNGNNDDAVSKNPLNIDASHYYFAPATNENIADATQAKFTQGKLFSWAPREAPNAFNPNQNPLESHNIRQIDEFKTSPEYNEICKMQQNICNCFIQELDPKFWILLKQKEYVNFTLYGVEQAIKEAWDPAQLILKQFNLPEEQNNFLQDTWNRSTDYFRMPTRDSSHCQFDHKDLGYGKNTQKDYDLDSAEPLIIVKGLCQDDLIVSCLHELGHILQEFFWKEYAVIDSMQRDYDEDMSLLFEVAALNHLFKVDGINDGYFLLQQRLWDLVTEYLAHTMVMRVATNQSIFRKDDEDYKSLLRLSVKNGAKAEAQKIWNICDKSQGLSKELQVWKNIKDKINQIQDKTNQDRARNYIIDRASEKFLCFFGCSGGRLSYDFPYGKGFVKAVHLLANAKENPEHALQAYAQQNQTEEFFSPKYINECCQQFSKNFNILFPQKPIQEKKKFSFF